MVARLAQLHQDVGQLRPPPALTRLREHIDLAPQHELVHFSLHLGHPDEEVRLDLRRQVFRHVRFQPPQHEGAQDPMQLVDHALLRAVVLRGRGGVPW